jgi:hypothetical protein
MMHKYKKINIGLAALCLAVPVIIYWYWTGFCADGSCSYDLDSKFVEPLFWLSAGLIPSLLGLVFLNYKIFKNWILYIASWYLPLALIVISTVPASAGGLMNIDRTTASLWWMVGLFVLTMAFIGWYFWKNRQSD